MKRVAILLSIIFLFAITQTCFAQKIADDVYGKDTSEVPKRYVVDNYDFTVNKFVDGYVLLPGNNPQYGLVRFNGNVAVFKDTVTKKIKRFQAGEVNGFVAGRDTFRVFTDTVVLPVNPLSFRYPGGRLFIAPEFIEQLVYGDKLCLYKALRKYPNVNYRAMGGNATNVEVTFYLKRKNDSRYIYIPPRKRDFKKLMVSYLGDNTTLMDDIDTGLLKYDNIDEIVKRYNNAN